MTWRTWALAVIVAAGLTTAACLGVVWLIGAACVLLAIGVRLVRLTTQLRVGRSPGDIDMKAFQDTVRVLEGTRFQLENLSDADRAGPRGDRLRAEYRWLCSVLSTQYRGLEPEMPIMDPFPVCPSCDVKGAAVAELDPTGGAWRRTCWECGHRWSEWPS